MLIVQMMNDANIKMNLFFSVFIFNSYLLLGLFIDRLLKSIWHIMLKL